MERIWNLQELQSMPEWEQDKEGDWLNIKKKTWITKQFIGEPIDSLKQKGYPVLDEMIAKTETELVQEAVTQMGDKLQERLDKGEIGITLENGTTITEGERYRYIGWKSHEYIKIISFGKTKMFAVDQEGKEDVWYTPSVEDKDFIPYTEPKEEPKPLEGYQKWYEKYDNGLMQVCYSKLRPVNINITYYTEQEAIDLGLKL